MNSTSWLWVNAVNIDRTHTVKEVITEKIWFERIKVIVCLEQIPHTKPTQKTQVKKNYKYWQIYGIYYDYILMNSLQSTPWLWFCAIHTWYNWYWYPALCSCFTISHNHAWRLVPGTISTEFTDASHSISNFSDRTV